MKNDNRGSFSASPARAGPSVGSRPVHHHDNPDPQASSPPRPNVPQPPRHRRRGSRPTGRSTTTHPSSPLRMTGRYEVINEIQLSFCRASTCSTRTTNSASRSGVAAAGSRSSISRVSCCTVRA